MKNIYILDYLFKVNWFEEDFCSCKQFFFLKGGMYFNVMQQAYGKNEYSGVVNKIYDWSSVCYCESII